jgi:hypothetical protein
MTTLLANLTGALFAEMHLALQTGRLTPKLDAALAQYISYWKKTGGSADAVIDFVRRLLHRARQAEAVGAHGPSAQDALVEQIVERSMKLYFEATRG